MTERWEAVQKGSSRIWLTMWWPRKPLPPITRTRPRSRVSSVGFSDMVGGGRWRATQSSWRVGGGGSKARMEDNREENKKGATNTAACSWKKIWGTEIMVGTSEYVHTYSVPLVPIVNGRACHTLHVLHRGQSNGPGGCPDCQGPSGVTSVTYCTTTSSKPPLISQMPIGTWKGTKPRTSPAEKSGSCGGCIQAHCNSGDQRRRRALETNFAWFLQIGLVRRIPPSLKR